MLHSVGRYRVRMSTVTREDTTPPVNFRNAPTVTRDDGRRELTDDAARELGDQIAARYATLLDRLAKG